MEGQGSNGNTAWPEDGVTDEMIARRAYELARSGYGGSELENWFRAAAQLRAERASEGEPAASA